MDLIGSGVHVTKGEKKMPEFRFRELKQIDKSLVQIEWFEIIDGKESLIGDQNIMTPESWTAFQEQVLRTRVKTEG